MSKLGDKMTTNKKLVQLSLISIGVFLILATYFFYPKIYKEQPLEKANIKEEMFKTEEATDNLFENIEYKGVYDINNPFTVGAKKAYVLTENPKIVFMTNVKVTLNMDDGKAVIITGDKGKYNKETYDILVEGNVKASDNNTIILAENLDLLASEDFVSIYNNVVLTNDDGSLRADKINYDFENKQYKISMFSDKKVKIRLIE